MKKIIIALLLCIFTFEANAIDLQTKKATGIYQKIFTKFWWGKTDESIQKLKEIQKLLQKVTYEKKLRTEVAQLISDIKKLNNEKIFNLERKKIKEKSERKFVYTRNVDYFTKKIYSPDFLILEDGVWYTYVFSEKKYFDRIDDYRVENYKHHNFDPYTTLVYYDDDRFYLVDDYKKLRLVSDNLISGIANKQQILELLRDYKKIDPREENIDSIFRAIKSTSEKITKNATTDKEKIEKLYSYIINSIQYTSDVKDTDREPFSWIKTFVNKDWVCQWYAELLSILLGYQDIEATVMAGDVINSVDFPEIGHAWVKIGNSYYDPTFDDTDTQWEKKGIKDFKYYGLPKTIFYTNRYDEGKTPEILLSKDIVYREQVVEDNLKRVYKNSPKKDYKLFDFLIFKDKYNITTDIKNIEALAKDIGFYEMTNYVATIDGKKKNISNINYYEMTDENIESLLSQIHYNFDEYKIFKWNKDGEIKYIISNDYVF